jgi:hypothetical protein
MAQNFYQWQKIINPIPIDPANSLKFRSIKNSFFSSTFNVAEIRIIQHVPELPPHRKQGCADSKRDSKMTKIKFPVAYIKFSISPIPEARSQLLLKNRTGC